MYNQQYLNDLISRSLREDIGTGDITTLATIDKATIINGRFIAKQCGIVCGLEVARAVFRYVDADIQLVEHFCDGDQVKVGDIIAEVKGRAIPVLTGERLALNFMQRMSGIATRTHGMVQNVAGYKTEILDTRKTTPGLRLLEKYAVKIGGGRNHRMNLADGILIKDNHIRSAGSITKAIQMAKKVAPHTLKVEVEVEDMGGVNEALSAGADIIMLDNMDAPTMKQAVDIIAGRALTEASGNMDQKDLAEVAATGVDFISVGALTHSVKSMDISLKFDPLATQSL